MVCFLLSPHQIRKGDYEIKDVVLYFFQHAPGRSACDDFEVCLDNSSYISQEELRNSEVIRLDELVDLDIGHVLNYVAVQLAILDLLRETGTELLIAGALKLV